MINSGLLRIISFLSKSKSTDLGTLITAVKSLHFCHIPLARSKSQVPPSLKGRDYSVSIMGTTLGTVSHTIIIHIVELGKLRQRVV